MKDEHSSAGVSSACQFVMVLGRNLAMDKDVRVIIVWNKGAQVNATVSHSVPLEAFAAQKGSAASNNFRCRKITLKALPFCKFGELDHEALFND
jgi:hypothetical protein